MITTKAFRSTEIKKNSRAERDRGQWLIETQNMPQLTSSWVSTSQIITSDTDSIQEEESEESKSSIFGSSWQSFQSVDNDVICCCPSTVVK